VKIIQKIKSDIFIPTSNRYDALKMCLDSLNKQTSKDFKIFIVGINKNTKIQSLIESYENLEIEYFIQTNKGIIGAANEALLKMKNDIFIRIDDDVSIDSEWHENIINTFLEGDNIGGVTGPTIMTKDGVKSRDLTAFLDKFQKSNNPILRFVNHLYKNVIFDGRMMEVSTFLESGAFTLGSNYKTCLSIKNPVEVSNLEACNWSCKRKLLNEIGGFDTVFLKGLGDYHEADSALQIKRMGYKLLFNPKVILNHRVEIGKVSKARPMPYYRIQNFIIFYFRHFDLIAVNKFRAIFLFLINLTMQNGYYLFKFFSTRKINQLGAIFGTFVGVSRVVVSKLFFLKI
jgi:GT2 family glycosyltransferase